MDELIERIRREIRKQGHKTATRIKIELSKTHESEEVNEILSSLECKDIKKIQYTNTYLADFTMKDMYVYDPRQTKKKVKRKRRTKTKS